MPNKFIEHVVENYVKQEIRIRYPQGDKLTNVKYIYNDKLIKLEFCFPNVSLKINVGIQDVQNIDEFFNNFEKNYGYIRGYLTQSKIIEGNAHYEKRQ